MKIMAKTSRRPRRLRPEKPCGPLVKICQPLLCGSGWQAVVFLKETGGKIYFLAACFLVVRRKMNSSTAAKMMPTGYATAVL